MFKGRKEELEYLLEVTEDYRNNLQVLCEHLSATTDVPSVRELETELLQVTEANRFDINEVRAPSGTLTPRTEKGRPH
jgi:hypothetical protein